MISNILFWLVIILPLFLILIISLFFFKISENSLELKKTNLISGWFSFFSFTLILFLIIGNILFFPNIYSLENDGRLTKKTLIIPQKIGNKIASYSSGLIINNETLKTLKLESHNYGISNNKSFVIKIEPKTFKEIQIQNIDFLFREAPSFYYFKRYSKTTLYSLNYEHPNTKTLVKLPQESENFGVIFWKIIGYTIFTLFILIILASIYYRITDYINSKKSAY